MGSLLRRTHQRLTRCRPWGSGRLGIPRFWPFVAGSRRATARHSAANPRRSGITAQFARPTLHKCAHLRGHLLPCAPAMMFARTSAQSARLELTRRAGGMIRLRPAFRPPQDCARRCVRDTVAECLSAQTSTLSINRVVPSRAAPRTTRLSPFWGDCRSLRLRTAMPGAQYL